MVVLWRRLYKGGGQVQGQIGRLNPASLLEGHNRYRHPEPIDQGVPSNSAGHDAEA